MMFPGKADDMTPTDLSAYNDAEFTALSLVRMMADEPHLQTGMQFRSACEDFEERTGAGCAPLLMALASLAADSLQAMADCAGRPVDEVLDEMSMAWAEIQVTPES